MATTSDIRKGMCLELNGDTYIITYFQHVKPGKGNAFVRTKIKSLTTGKVIDNTFQAGHKVEEVRVERRTYQFLYPEGDDYHFMNMETFNQIMIPGEMIDNKEFLKEGNSVTVLFHTEKEIPLTCELPQHLELKVESVVPGVKGDTATNTTTPARLETGAEVRVPLFIKEGDIIKIDTQTGDYLERVKN